jgi:flagellin
MNQSGANFSLGGEKWATMTASQTGTKSEVWNVVLNGRDVGDGRNLWLANISKAGTNPATLEIPTLKLFGSTITKNGKLLERSSFAEVQNAANAPWAGAEIRSQDSAQKALSAVDEAIEYKDKIRATLGAYQNRLENTISNLEIQSENLQAAESRISDVDVAREITQLTKNTVLVQAATSMVAQANSLNNLALSLLG